MNTPGTLITVAGSVYLNFMLAETATLDGFKSFLAAQHAAGTPVQIAYKLAEPIEIQLTPSEIIALPGVITLYGDGTIAVTGRQPKTNALEERLAALEAVIANA